MNTHRVLLACMPKSGSTFLSSAIAALPGFARAHLVPGYSRREQELCVEKLKECAALGSYVAQHHVRYSDVTQEYVNKFELRPIILVRNIFDIIPSLVDHHSREGCVYPAAFAPFDIAIRSAEEQIRFVTQMAIPWYFNFFMSWNQCQNKLLVTYEEFIFAPDLTLQRICEYLNFPVSELEIHEAIQMAGTSGLRKNKVTPGRGELLPSDCIEEIKRMAFYYRGVDFSPMGISDSADSPL